MKDRMFSATSLQDEKESWMLASDKIRDSIHFASSFTSAIRCLKVNGEENKLVAASPRKLNEASQFQVGRLFKAPSILAPLYFFSLTFKREELEGKEHVSPEFLMSLYTIDELAALLGLIYTYHRLRRACDAEEWARYGKTVCEVMEIGAHLGMNVPELGLANGILLTGMRYLALAVFMKTDPKTFKTYRRDLKIKKKAFDKKIELAEFGFTHMEVATQFLQTLGYGVKYAEDFGRAVNVAPDREISKSANSMRILLYWTEALYLGTKPPVIWGEDDIVISESVVDKLLLVSQNIRKSGSEHSWIAKGKSSITKKEAPQLYLEGQTTLGKAPKALGRAKAKKQTEVIEDFDLDMEGIQFMPYSEVPVHLREHLSEEAYEALTEEISQLVAD